MNREFLRSLEISDDNIEKIMAEHGSTIQKQEGRITTLQSKNDVLNEHLKELDSQLSDLKKSSDGNKGLEDKIATLEKKNEEIINQYHDLMVESAIKDAVGNTAKNINVILKLIEQDKIRIEDGAVVGVDDEIKRLKEESDFLFHEEKQDDTEQSDTSDDVPDNAPKQPDVKTDVNYNAGTIRGNKGKEVDAHELGKQYAKQLFGDTE